MLNAPHVLVEDSSALKDDDDLIATCTSVAAIGREPASESRLGPSMGRSQLSSC